MKAAPTSEQRNRERLLGDLACFASGGVAEEAAQSADEEFFRSHLPIPEHRRVLDRDTMLILGGRGTGKTQLFDALRRLHDPSQLIPGAGTSSISKRKDIFLTGYTATRTTDHPRSEVLQRCIGDDPEHTVANLWVGLLAGILLKSELVGNPIKRWLGDDVAQALLGSLASPMDWLKTVDDNLGVVHLALDNVDKMLRDQERYVYVTYDDLDILATRMTQVYPLIRELLAFWLRNSRRWGQLRCKIFLRTDIFDADELAFVDSSKLRPRSVTLRWTPDNLYRLVLKRLLNRDEADAWKQFLEGAIPSSRIPVNEPWGIVPNTGEKEHLAFVERLVGEYMGSDPRKGATYSWFLNHLQDSLGDIAPRSFTKLFEISAKRQQDIELPRSPHILDPQQIQGALVEVSQDRIAELTREEYPWIKRIATCLKDQTVPMERKEFRKLVKIKWDDDESKPLYTGPDRLIDYLVSLGILRATSDRRIHVPDIYLYGFQLKRKGGIRRPKP